eukprot:jgi/Orpsp1_1/1177442/evm.model.c7180000061457.1
MKILINLIIGLSLSSFVLSGLINHNEKEKEKRDDCVRSFDECFFEFELSDKSSRDEMCNVVKSSKCQELFGSNISEVKGCENLEEKTVTDYTYKLKIASDFYLMYCAKDDNNDYCPFDYESIKNNKETAQSITDKLCQIKNCSTSLVKYYLDIEEYIDIMKNKYNEQVGHYDYNCDKLTELISNYVNTSCKDTYDQLKNSEKNKSSETSNAFPNFIKLNYSLFFFST